jgi:hypothetical protein
MKPDETSSTSLIKGDGRVAWKCRICWATRLPVVCGERREGRSGLIVWTAQLLKEGIRMKLNERQEINIYPEEGNETTLIYIYNGAVHVQFCWSTLKKNKVMLQKLQEAYHVAF